MFKKILISSLLILSLNSISYAQPYLVCDPNPSGVEWYEIEGLPYIESGFKIPVEPDGSIKLDLNPTVVGTFNLNVRVCNVWECSVYVPFVLIRPEKLNQSLRYQIRK